MREKSLTFIKDGPFTGIEYKDGRLLWVNRYELKQLYRELAKVLGESNEQ